jgi:hypothetical protein
MHSQAEIDAANQVLRELREIDTEVDYIDLSDLDPPTMMLEMPDAANDSAPLPEERARA